MGGAAVTTLKLPTVMLFRGGVVFCTLPLGAATWVIYKDPRAVPSSLPPYVYLGLCGLSYAAGIAGRLFVPTHPLAIKLVGKLAGKAKCEDAVVGKAAEVKTAPPAEEAKTAPEGEATAPGVEATPAAAPGARKRVTSPAPERKAAPTAEAGA